MESWDDEDFEPKEIKPTPTVAGANKWEGEDEDDDVKESWEDEDEDKDKSDKSDDKPDSLTQPKPKKKSLAEKIAEKERQKREEIERRLKEEAVDEEEMSPEERMRRQKESDLKLALETTFGDNQTELGIDGMCPQTEEEFDDFANTLMKKIQPMAKSTEYPNFCENLIRSICVTLTSFDIKKIKTTIDNLYLEKQKIEKGDKTKKNKGKGKVKLKLEDNNQYSAYAVDTYDEFDDFM